MAGAAALGFDVAQAQHAPGDTTSQEPVVQPSSASALPDQTAAPAPSVFQRYDDLSLKGWDIPFPKIADTTIGDKGGIRSKLADLGIGFLGFNTTTCRIPTSATTDGNSTTVSG